MPTVVLIAAVLVLVQLLSDHAGARGHAGVVQVATIMQCVHEQFYQHCQRLVVGWRGLFCRAVLACSIFVTFCDPPAAYHAAELGCAACAPQVAAVVQCVREQLFQRCMRFAVGWGGLLCRAARSVAMASARVGGVVLLQLGGMLLAYGEGCMWAAGFSSWPGRPPGPAEHAPAPGPAPCARGSASRAFTI